MHSLDGIRILDLSRVLAGPWATQTLADLGADVIKIERPGAGDDTRSWGPPFLQDQQGKDSAEAAYYLGTNRNKRSVTCDISCAEGQQLKFQLVDRGGKVSAAELEVVGDVIAVEKRAEAPQRELTGERSTGTVKFFNAMKGFGFITRDDGQADAFVHISAVERSGMAGLNEGDRLEFDIEVDRRGKYSAVNLVPRQD